MSDGGNCTLSSVSRETKTFLAFEIGFSLQASQLELGPGDELLKSGVRSAASRHLRVQLNPTALHVYRTP